MAKLTIYDAGGNVFEREAVDARECVASGFYRFEKPGIKFEPFVPTENVDDQTGGTHTHTSDPVLDTDTQAGPETGAPVSGGEVGGETVKAKAGKK